MSNYIVLRGTAEITVGPGQKEDEIRDAAEWAEQKLGFELDGTQARALRSESKRVILNCTRQWGKSTVTAAKAVYEALTQPESLILVVSGWERQRGELV